VAIVTQKTIKGYRILRLIGKGGMAAIYLAENIATKEEVALKVLLPHIASDQDYVLRFLHEVRANKKLEHPNIVRIIDCDEVKGNYFMAMEYIAGVTLQDLLKRVRTLPRSCTLYILREILEGLKYSHSRQIVHRDIKPSNILIAHDGQIKISDFGISKSINFTRLTQTGSIIGTPAYMSPEQGRGKSIDIRSDIFSSGIILYECLCGENPFFSDNPTTAVLNILQKEPSPIFEYNPTISPMLERIVELMIRKDLAERYQNTEDVLKDLFEYELHEENAVDRETFRSFMEDPETVANHLNRQEASLIIEKAEQLYKAGEEFFNQALWEYFRASFLDNHNTLVQNRLREICALKKFNIAPVSTPKIEQLEKQLSESPDNISVLTQLAKLHRMSGNFFQVITYLKRLSKLKPNDGYIMGQMEALIGDKTLLRNITGSAWSSTSMKTASGIELGSQNVNLRRKQPTSQQTLPLVDLVNVEATGKKSFNKTPAILLGGVVLLVVAFAVWFLLSMLDSMSEMKLKKNALTDPDTSAFSHFQVDQDQSEGGITKEMQQLFEEAESAFEKKNFLRAQTLFLSFQKQFPEKMKSVLAYRLALIEKNLGNFEGALDQLEFLISLNPEKRLVVFAHRERAQIYSIQNEYYDAEQEYEEILDNLSSVPEIDYQVECLLDYGKFLKSQQRFSDALDITEKILEDYSAVEFQTKARSLRADIFLEQNNIAGAKEEYRLILKNMPAEKDEYKRYRERLKMLQTQPD